MHSKGVVFNVPPNGGMGRMPIQVNRASTLRRLTMQEKTDQILEAGIKVFKDKGYKGASTKAIAQEAQVGEVTIYRKFNTKHLLFEEAVRSELMLTFTMESLDAKMDTRAFFTVLFEDRFAAISQNRKLMKLVIRESLSKNLPEDLQYASVIHNALKRPIEKHLDHHAIHADPAMVTRTVAGILIAYILSPPTPDFNAMDVSERKHLVAAHVDSVEALLEIPEV